MNYALLAVDTPFNNSLLTYSYSGDIFKGDIYKVPLGSRTTLGVVLEINIEVNEDFEIKDILEKVGKLTDNQFQLFNWMSGYYHYNLGQLIFNLIKVGEDSESDIVLGKGQELPYKLTPSQLDIMTKISLDNFYSYLLYGVTGSGKTSIYLKVMEKVLKNEGTVLYLIPEINLTSQLVKFFTNYLPANVAIYTYHSGVSVKKRCAISNEMKKNGPKLIIGTRSSLFLPFLNLKLIIIDEEHDTSFKQEDRIMYSARDMGIKLAQMLNIPVILGSATPSVETFYRCKDALRLIDRIGAGKLPKLQTIKTAKDGTWWPLSEEIIERIKDALYKGEQVIVFINRLGYSNYITCSACSHVFKCPNCSVSLKTFAKKNILHCSYCNHKEPIPTLCPKCQNLVFLHRGFGTEKVVEVLQKLFKDKVIQRFDREEVNSFKKVNSILTKFHEGRIDILVGTQMLSKGHNFEKVNLVIILGIDSQLSFPDFRSYERAYQQLMQVSGRAGRYSGNGEVIIATSNGGSPIFSYLNNGDEFYKEELVIRKELDFPPFSKIAVVYFTSKDKSKAKEVADYVINLFNNKAPRDTVILGPTTTMVEKRVGKYTWYVMIKSHSIKDLHSFLQNISEMPVKGLVDLKIDVDPVIIG